MNISIFRDKNHETVLKSKYISFKHIIISENNRQLYIMHLQQSNHANILVFPQSSDLPFKEEANLFSGVKRWNNARVFHKFGRFYFLAVFPNTEPASCHKQLLTSVPGAGLPGLSIFFSGPSLKKRCSMSTKKCDRTHQPLKQ